VWLYPRQEEVLVAICTGDRVAVRSGHKCGKSTVAVIAALWFACCFPRARVLLTAPTNRQVRDILWAELRRVCRGARIPLGATPMRTPAGGMKWDDGREVIGFSTDKTENMAGYSGPHVLWVIDEASGFSEAVFEAIEGNAQSGAKIFAISNPTSTSGWFYDAFHRRATEWKRIRISSEEAAQYADKIPGLSRPEQIAKRIASLGRDHPIIRVRVLGEFPSAASNTVVSVAIVEAAHERWRAIYTDRLAAHYGTALPEDATPADLAPKLFGLEDGPLELGVDVARFGDDSSVITPRRGKVVMPYVVIHGYDTQAVAGAVVAVARAYRVPHERVSVKVDGIGYGAGVVDALRRDEFKDLVDVHDVNVAEKSDDEEKFPNLRSQLCFGVAEFLADGGILPPMGGEEDGVLDAELLTPIYTFDPQGRRKVESKSEIKVRLNRSPDRGDSLALAVYRRHRPRLPKRSGGTGGGNGYRFGLGRGF
jgi:phage terminase large subunit